MHSDEVHIDDTVVRRLVVEQFPHWRDEPIHRVASDGTVNAIYRIGPGLAARFPLRAADPTELAAELARNAAAMLELAACCPFPTPVPVAVGAPGDGYTLPWSVQTWLVGDVATPAAWPTRCDSPGTWSNSFVRSATQTRRAAGFQERRPRRASAGRRRMGGHLPSGKRGPAPRRSAQRRLGPVSRVARCRPGRDEPRRSDPCQPPRRRRGGWSACSTAVVSALRIPRSTLSRPGIFSTARPADVPFRAGVRRRGMAARRRLGVRPGPWASSWYYRESNPAMSCPRSKHPRPDPRRPGDGGSPACGADGKELLRATDRPSGAAQNPAGQAVTRWAEGDGGVEADPLADGLPVEVDGQVEVGEHPRRWAGASAHPLAGRPG